MLLAGICVLSLFSQNIQAQAADWQQHVNYVMDIDVDADFHQYKGHQVLTYTNNSPDTLHRVFYHLFFNAFQPGSMMDVRSLSIKDPDGRVADRISQLKPDEIGYIRPNSLMQDGVALTYEVVETILEVNLAESILPGATTVLEMNWDAQVPLQIRRSGRDNAEGVEFSMSQWYPKLSEYDARGWHPDPYVGREFYGVWGDFDVTIHMDKDYVIGGTGYLQNPEEIGHGYGEITDKKKFRKAKKLDWHFKAPNVHDFVWAADPDFIHDIRTCASGLELHFFYQDMKDEEDKKFMQNWVDFQPDVERLFDIASERYGKYAYDKYAVIQGGDGGMEYPMATLITGKRNYKSLLGVTVHEAMHSWYQMMLATNEALYPWMDEGFTSYASSEIMHVFFPKDDARLVHNGAFRGYDFVVKSGEEEALCTHGDHYAKNRSYGIAVYNKGEVFLDQLSYIIGQDALDRSLLRYFDEWKFKHPDMYDFLHVAEKVSGLELDWYIEYFVNTTKYADIALVSVEAEGKKTRITLERKGEMIVPVDVYIGKDENELTVHTIPLGLMRGAKSQEFEGGFFVEKDWFWTDSTYSFVVDRPLTEIGLVEVDSSLRLADVDRSNNFAYFEAGKQIIIESDEPVKNNN
jgi:hypothetical protein